MSDSFQPHGIFQDSLSVGFSRQEYWSGLPFPPPGNLSNPGIELLSFRSPALADAEAETPILWPPDGKN